MSARLTRRLLALAMIVSVVVLATAIVGHSHAQASEEQNCQICHFGHAPFPEPATATAVQAPVSFTRYVPVFKISADTIAIRTLSIPRAPPA